VLYLYIGDSTVRTLKFRLDELRMYIGFGKQEIRINIVTEMESGNMEDRKWDGNIHEGRSYGSRL
jgi:hypothetical protein